MPESPVPADSGDPGDPRIALERELYWAEETTPRATMSLQELRMALVDFTASLRADERARIPRDEPHLGARYRWRRRMKAGIFLALRPVRRRYDRLVGDLAELTAALAGRVADLETEVAHLRTQRDPEAGTPVGRDGGA